MDMEQMRECVLAFLDVPLKTAYGGEEWRIKQWTSLEDITYGDVAARYYWNHSRDHSRDHPMNYPIDYPAESILCDKELLQLALLGKTIANTLGERNGEVLFMQLSIEQYLQVCGMEKLYEKWFVSETEITNGLTVGDALNRSLGILSGEKSGNRSLAKEWIWILMAEAPDRILVRRQLQRVGEIAARLAEENSSSDSSNPSSA